MEHSLNNMMDLLSQARECSKIVKSEIFTFVLCNHIFIIKYLIKFLNYLTSLMPLTSYLLFVNYFPTGLGTFVKNFFFFFLTPGEQMCILIIFGILDTD